MEKRLSKQTDLLKGKTFSKRDQLYIGIDVHKHHHSIAFWLNGKIVKTFVTPADNIKIAEMLSPYKIAIKKVVYEAGPTGFHLARFLQSCGFSVEVISPSEVPDSPGKKAKTDRLDCTRLAIYSAKGLLRSVSIPTEQQESERQLSRLRDQLVSKRKRVKQQVKSLLLQYGIKEPLGLKNFSKAGIEELKSINLCVQLRYCIDSLIDELFYFTDKIHQVEKQLKELFSRPEHKQTIDIALSHPGVGDVTARQFVLEMHNPKRFSKPAEIASYLGLCPKVKQSGEKRRDGNIVMTSRATLRANLIESSWSWIRQDRYARAVFLRILHNSGQVKKAIVAMARRLAIHLWMMLYKKECYRLAA